jgi:hypothetical protein
MKIMAASGTFRDLDEQVKLALRKKNVASLVPLALQYNIFADQLDLDDPTNIPPFCEAKNKAAEIYNEIANLMKIPNSKLLAALYHVQGKNFDRAYKITDFLLKSRPRGGKDKFLDAKLMTTVQLLTLQDPQQALKELHNVKGKIDPQIKEIILQTAEILKKWQKGG